MSFMWAGRSTNNVVDDDNLAEILELFVPVWGRGGAVGYVIAGNERLKSHSFLFNNKYAIYNCNYS